MLEDNNEAVSPSEAEVTDKAKVEENVISLVRFFDDNDPTPKWITKASVFTNLFSETGCRFRFKKKWNQKAGEFREDSGCGR